MKTYHGERTERGCDVTVDGAPLRMCSNLSGNATTAFDWGYVGTGQLSVALLSDLLHNDNQAKAMCEAFEREVVANMPHENWTMTDRDLTTALAPLIGVDGARANDVEADGDARAAFGDMPVTDTDPVLTLEAEDAGAAGSIMSEFWPLVRLGDMLIGNVKTKSPNDRAAREAGHVASNAEDAAVDAANVALILAEAARQAAHAGDTPADEAMSTANRAADHKAYSAGRAADKAVALALKSVDDQRRDRLLH